MSKVMPTYIFPIIPSPFSLSVRDLLNRSPQHIQRQLQPTSRACNPNLQKKRIPHNLNLRLHQNVLIVRETVIWKISVLISIPVAIVASEIIPQKNVVINKNQRDWRYIMNGLTLWNGHPQLKDCFSSTTVYDHTLCSQQWNDDGTLMQLNGGVKQCKTPTPEGGEFKIGRAHVWTPVT